MGCLAPSEGTEPAFHCAPSRAFAVTNALPLLFFSRLAPAILLLSLTGCSTPPFIISTALFGSARDVLAGENDSRTNAARPVSTARATQDIVRSRKSGPDVRTASLKPSPSGSSSTLPQEPKPERIGLVGSEINGTFARLAADFHGALERHDLRVSLSASGGPLQTIDDILHRPGVDAGVVQADALERLRLDDPSASAERHLRLVAPLWQETLHVVARSYLTTLRQLDSLKVNVGKAGGGSDLTARVLFGRLGMNASFTNFETEDALARLAAGEIDAVVLLAQGPAQEILLLKEEGLHLVDVPWEPAMGQIYRPTELQLADYPTLDQSVSRVPTIAVDVVLAAYNWRKGTRGYSRVQKLAKALHAQLENEQAVEEHFAWKEVDLTRDVPGWERLERDSSNSD